MVGAAKGRIGKKRSSKSSATPSRANQRTPPSSRSSMRRGLNRLGRTTTVQRNGASPTAINSLFSRFKEPSEEKIGPEGMQALFQALDVDPLDIISLVFAWKLKAKVPFEFSRAEFIEGLTNLNCDSVDKLKACLPSLKESLNNEEDFRDFYMFAFDYNKPPEQRSLPIETARQLFPLILEGRFQHLSLWVEFLQGKKQAISRDTYSLLLDFTRTIDYNFSNFDEVNGAWPVLLDEFVDFAKPQVKNDKDAMAE